MPGVWADEHPELLRAADREHIYLAIMLRFGPRPGSWRVNEEEWQFLYDLLGSVSHWDKIHAPGAKECAVRNLGVQYQLWCSMVPSHGLTEKADHAHT